MVVEQLVERSLPRPEIRGSNRDIGKLYLLSTILKLCGKDENEIKNGSIY